MLANVKPTDGREDPRCTRVTSFDPQIRQIPDPILGPNMTPVLGVRSGPFWGSQVASLLTEEPDPHFGPENDPCFGGRKWPILGSEMAHFWGQETNSCKTFSRTAMLRNQFGSVVGFSCVGLSGAKLA